MIENDGSYDLILEGGDVINGDGVSRIRADVGIRESKIVGIGDLSGGIAEERSDVTGLVVCPGFVDIHAHADLMTVAFPGAVNKIQQGITTEVVGNCGSGIAPIPGELVRDQIREAQSAIDIPGLDWDWADIEGYLARVEEVDAAVSVAALVGHLPLRAGVVGFDERSPTPDEIERMQSDLDRMILQGAVGISFGLMRPPSSYATREEMVGLGRVIANHDALMSVHMRDYASGLLDAVHEILEVAERSGCRLQISHLTVVGEENWGLVSRAIDIIDAASDSGVDVAFDIYPYLAGSTSLSQKVPRWAMDGGLSGLRSRLADPETRGRIAAAMESDDPRWDWTMLGFVPQDESLNGLTVEEAAAGRGLASVDLVLELLAVSDPVMVAFGRSEDDLRAVLSHPLSMIGSDGLVVLPPETSGGSLPHPRAFGAYPGFFQRYVREQQTVSLERAVQMCTSAPASRARLSDRGFITTGARADLVAFDPDRIAEVSTYTEPRRPPVGVEQVVANGTRVVADGIVTGQRGNNPVRGASSLR